MPLPPGFLDELRARLPVSEVVGRRVPLQRSGRELKACCPFHKEKSPSFTVNDQKGFFHCFGCGAHGDAIGFVMQHDRLGFMEAVELLATQAGLAVPQATGEERAAFERRKTLHDLVEAACRFFEDELRGPAGRAALAYLQRRGLDDETIARFRLGYAPGDARLIRHLRGAGFADLMIEEAGLARKPEDGRDLYAFFRNRVMFPVADKRGRVVAFGARILEGEGPKYINSPDGDLFHKGKLLYGLSRAREAAAQGQTVIVAEGYMDVIALVRGGFEAAVAPLGTALTEEQIQELWRLDPGNGEGVFAPVLCFDGDDAGFRAARRAAERSMPILSPGYSFRFCILPRGEDPDSLLRSGGPIRLQPLVKNAVSFADFVWSDFMSASKVGDTDSLARLKHDLVEFASKNQNGYIRKQYIQEFSNKCFALWREMSKKRETRDVIHISRLSIRPFFPKGERIVLALALVVPDLLREHQEWISKTVLSDGHIQFFLEDMRITAENFLDMDFNNLKAALVDQGHAESIELIMKELDIKIVLRSENVELKARSTFDDVFGRFYEIGMLNQIKEGGELLKQDFQSRNSDYVLSLVRALSKFRAERYGEAR